MMAAGSRGRVGKAKRAHAAVPTAAWARRVTALCPPYDAHPNKSYPRPENRSYTRSPSPLAEGRLPEAFVGRSGERRLGFRLASGGLEARNPPAGESRPPRQARGQGCVSERPADRVPARLGTGTEAGFRVSWPGRQPHGRCPLTSPGVGRESPKSPRRALRRAPLFGLPDWRSSSARHPSRLGEGTRSDRIRSRERRGR